LAHLSTDIDYNRFHPSRLLFRVPALLFFRLASMVLKTTQKRNRTERAEQPACHGSIVLSLNDLQFMPQPFQIVAVTFSVTFSLTWRKNVDDCTVCYQAGREGRLGSACLPEDYRGYP